jgi:hypothetical protein
MAAFCNPFREDTPYQLPCGAAASDFAWWPGRQMEILARNSSAPAGRSHPK